MKTAVEFLVEKLNKKGFASVVMDEEIQQAMEMEKKQIIDCCIETTQFCWISILEELNQELVFTDEDLQNQKNEAEQYYNETFKQEKK
jgi:predicted GNAT family acetyltransferase